MSAKTLQTRAIAPRFVEGRPFKLSERSLAGRKVVYELRDAPSGRGIVIEGVALIGAPAEAIFNVLTDFANYRFWKPTIVQSAVTERDGRLVQVRMRHEVGIIGEFDCHQSWRLPEPGGELVLDCAVTECIVDSSSGRYCVTPATKGTGTVVHYFQEGELGEWIPNFVMGWIVEKEYRNMVAALERRIGA